MSLLQLKPPTLKELLADLACEALNGNESDEEIEEMMTQRCGERDLIMDWLSELLVKDREQALKKNQVLNLNVTPMKMKNGLISMYVYSMIHYYLQTDTDENAPPNLDLLAAIKEESGGEMPRKSAEETLVASLSERAIPRAKDLVEGKLEKRVQIQTWMLVLRSVKESRDFASRTREEVSGALSAALSRPLTRRCENPKHRARILPRDIDREVRPQFKKILPPSDATLEQGWSATFHEMLPH